MMIKADVQDKAFLQDKKKIMILNDKIENKGYITQALSWNEEDEIFELIVRSTDQNHYQQTFTIGRSLFTHQIIKNVCC